MEVKRFVARLPAQASGAGKRVGGALYLHRSAIFSSGKATREAVDDAVRIAEIRTDAFNVIKLIGDPPQRVSLLAYEDFDTSAFPALLDSWTIDLAGSHSVYRSYRSSQNPPILHRKELLLAPADPRRPIFARLTRDLEERGLFREATSIGYRQGWTTRLDSAGVTIRDHAVCAQQSIEDIADDSGTSVERHRTAMARTTLSAPMQALARHGFLDGELAIFDYGCGRGDDLSVLADAGIRAKGWDPHYFPGNPLEEADVVNLGYVLNVIENPAERTTTLRAAFDLTRRVLAIAVMIVGKADTGKLQRYSDGFLTARGTFQKYFTQEEARSLIQTAIDQEAIPVAHGIFFAFRDKIAEQRFLQRRRRSPDISHLLAAIPSRARTAESRSDILIEEHIEIVDSVWKQAIRLGRLPYLDELDGFVSEELVERLGSVRKAAQLGQQLYGLDALNQARSKRADDLSVYFALNLFSRRQPYRELPPELQRDVKAFFGSYASAERSGRDLLFSIGDPRVILEAARQAESQGLGHLQGEHSIQVDERLFSRLPAVLRIYVGCAEQLYGDISEADLLKIHIQSGKLTLLIYEGYNASPLPRLRERIKINLRTQDIYFFEYDNGNTIQLLFCKSRYMAKDQSGYKRQKKFDEKLSSLDLFHLTEFGPSLPELESCLQANRRAIRGFDIVSLKR